MTASRFLLSVLCCSMLFGCSGDKPQELLETAQFEERQMNLPHARQLYDDVIRLYPASPQADIARARLAQLNASQ